MYLATRILAIYSIIVLSCSKPVDGPGDNHAPLSYGDSIFYLREKSYTASPTIARTGKYTAFPDHLKIDPSTGIITIELKNKEGNASQTGLRYKVYYQSTDNTQHDTTEIIIAGINYQDALFYTVQNQTQIQPIYQPGISQNLSFKNFYSSDGKLSIDPATGVIDIRKTIDNGFFNDIPQDHDWKLVTITYTNKVGTPVENEIEMIIYYYTSVDIIPSNVSGAMQAHQGLLLGIPPVEIPTTSAPVDESIKNIVSAAKPRPPCIIIVGH